MKTNFRFLASEGVMGKYSEPLQFRATFSGPTFFNKNAGIKHSLWSFLYWHSICWWHRTNIKITHANHSATSRAILTKLLVLPERLYFLFAFCTSHYPCRSLWQKNTKNNCFIQLKSPYLVIEVSNTFWRKAHFDVILTSLTILKQVFLCKLFCYESLVDIEVSKQ